VNGRYNYLAVVYVYLHDEVFYAVCIFALIVFLLFRSCLSYIAVSGPHANREIPDIGRLSLIVLK